MRPCWYQWTSEPHTPTDVTSTSTSRGPGVGTGRCSIAISPGRTSTAARLLITLLPSVIAVELGKVVPTLG
jgi:hypothetical protein